MPEESFDGYVDPTPQEEDRDGLQAPMTHRDELTDDGARQVSGGQGVSIDEPRHAVTHPDDDEPHIGPERARVRTRLTPVEFITIGQLAKQGLSIREIARATKRSKKAIHANLRASRQLLGAVAHEFAIDWKNASTKAASRGDHRPAMDALERLRVVEPLPKPEPVSQGPAFQVNIGLALPGIPAQPTQPAALPAITVEPEKDKR
jgi:hypothetical protein